MTVILRTTLAALLFSACLQLYAIPIPLPFHFLSQTTKLANGLEKRLPFNAFSAIAARFSPMKAPVNANLAAATRSAQNTIRITNAMSATQSAKRAYDVAALQSKKAAAAAYETKKKMITGEKTIEDVRRADRGLRLAKAELEGSRKKLASANTALTKLSSKATAPPEVAARPRPVLQTTAGKTGLAAITVTGGTAAIAAGVGVGVN